MQEPRHRPPPRRLHASSEPAVALTGNVQPDGTLLFKVSSSSHPLSIGAAIAHSIYEGQRPKLRAIGAGAVNQSVKAIAVADDFVATRGLRLLNSPSFEVLTIRGEETTAIVFNIEVTTEGKNGTPATHGAIRTSSSE